MNLDDEICYCFHVPMRKLVNFARQRDLKRPSQMSECFNAGTGCGWCIPVLTMIYHKTRPADGTGRDTARRAAGADPTGTGADGGPGTSGAGAIELPIAPSEYAARRDAYRAQRNQRHSFDDDAPT